MDLELEIKIFYFLKIKYEFINPKLKINLY